jgi:hypothetical protein
MELSGAISNPQVMDELWKLWDPKIRCFESETAEE